MPKPSSTAPSPTRQERSVAPTSATVASCLPWPITHCSPVGMRSASARAGGRLAAGMSAGHGGAVGHWLLSVVRDRRGRRVSYWRVRILVTNDDGVRAPGIAALVRALAGWVEAAVGEHQLLVVALLWRARAGWGEAAAGEHELIVGAPLENHSGASSAVGTVYERSSLDYERVLIEGAEDVAAYGLDASPALSVIVGVLGGFGPRPDVIVSGINLGVNIGRSV